MNLLIKGKAEIGVDIHTGVKRVENVVSYNKLQDRPLGQTAIDRNALIGNQLVDMFAQNSDFTEVSNATKR